MDMFDDTHLNEIIQNSIRTNLLNMYNGRERTIQNPNRIPLETARTRIRSRYYNTPPQGGYSIIEEHEYDYDDLNALVFLELISTFASPSTESELSKRIERKDKIKKIKYHKVKTECDTECSICLENLKVGEYQKTLECNHCFHKKCIDHWFRKNNDVCPMCRFKAI